VTEEAISVFLSYSRKDKDLLDSFAVHLAGLVNTGQITTWHDRDIEAGSEWEPVIQHQLNTAKIIILLISANFIASEYCYGNELKRAIERHDAGEAHVIPVILKPCLWNRPRIPFSQLNVLPNDALPVTQWSDPDAAFTIVVENIAKIVDRLETEHQLQRKFEKQRKLEIFRQQEAERQKQLKLEQQQDSLELVSEKGVDYRNLRDLLKAGKWREADQETFNVMLIATGRESEGWLDSDSLRDFPKKDLITINLLWVIASKGHFGFSVQKKIWQECGSPRSHNDENWREFGDRVGWRQKKSWLYYSKLKFALDLSPAGELPIIDIGGGVGSGFSLFSRNDL
jgi:hypothetical protein